MTYYVQPEVESPHRPPDTYDVVEDGDVVFENLTFEEANKIALALNKGEYEH